MTAQIVPEAESITIKEPIVFVLMRIHSLMELNALSVTTLIILTSRHYNARHAQIIKFTILP